MMMKGEAAVTISGQDADKAPYGPWVSVWRGINLFMAVFFLLATIANVNDGDWYIWMPIYMIPALLGLVVAAKPQFIETRLWSSLSVIHFTLCLAYAIYQGAVLVETLAGQVKNPLQHEEGREMGGLFIILAWLGISRFTSLGRPNSPVSNRSMMSALLLMTVTLAVLPLLMWSLCFVSDWHTKLGHCNGMFA
ncbi:transmembrane protein 220-like [Littorina saxatilis]|uniref:Transmembrane protein 220 n=1 Tax=Littorina saxatilis TaxID=31220 RepID=A0AAN9GL12_9CAEN